MRRRDFLAGAAAVPLVNLPFARRQSPARVNGDRLNAQLARLDSIGRTAGGINRVAYSDADLAGRQLALRLMKEAGLAVRIDTAGNILGRRPGTSPSLPPILIGSHVDSVPDGGNYDGPVGSFSAIEVARTLTEREISLRHPLEVVVFQNEEGGTVGSKAMIGALTDADLDHTARSGRTIRDGIGVIGGDVARLAEAVRKTGDLTCYLELHIEQGGTLDAAGLRIGVVEGIVGIRWSEVTVTGFANHAGTTPMDQRQDAMLAAAKFTVAANELIRSTPGRQVVTVGRMTATPGATNVIPGQVVLTVDLRDLSAEKLVTLSDRLQEAATRIGTETGTAFAFRALSASEPALADQGIQAVIATAADRLGLSHRTLPSGAGHDAQEIARIAPMGMIFVPSVKGISHSPREFTRPEDVVNGADVLLNAVLAVDRDGLRRGI